MLVHLEFNLFQEANRLNLYEKYFDKASALGVTLEEFYHEVNIFLDKNQKLEFDEGHLRPPDFLEFCTLIKVAPKKLYDKYYRFVLGKDFSKIILNNRLSLNLNQKEFAKLTRLSPVTIGYLENNKKYPTRKQYSQLSRLLTI
ncbi:helix-turn-helix domain-containing protein [uncultured Clostridium sp.]|uniref:helix-turn-helix domain-containing protein n=1 Tax=uncultured Clostridium sp. TaxID=59620 RepID=UPI00258B92CE|nr:helix-turn-helix domain-containing protein [uncultured Clostridium sp.]